MQSSADLGLGATPTRGPSDRELISRFLDTRDESAFAEIVSRYSRLVMSVALHTLRDPHAAEDAFQAAFLVLARNARRIRNRDSLASWLHGTTFRVSQRLLRTRLRRKEQELPPVELPSPIWANPERPDEQAALDEELARLSEGLRAPLVLHYLEGRTVPEIAAELKMSQSAIEGRLKRGKKTLRKRLLRRGVLLSSAAFGAGLTVPVEGGVAAGLVTATVAACLKTVASTSLTPIATSTIQQIALQETEAMARIALLKTALVCGGVAGTLGLIGMGVGAGAGTGDNGTPGTALVHRGGRARGPETGDSSGSPVSAMLPTPVIHTSLAQAPGTPNALLQSGGRLLTTDRPELATSEKAAVTPVAVASDGNLTSPGAKGATPPGAVTPSAGTTDPNLPEFAMRGQTDASIKALQEQVDQLRTIVEAQKALIEKTTGTPKNEVELPPQALARVANPKPDETSRTSGPRSAPAVIGANAGRGSGEVRQIRPRNVKEDIMRDALSNSINFQFAGQTLHEVVDFLTQSNNIDIRLDTTELTNAGVTPEAEITLMVSNVSLRSGLNMLLKNVEGTALDYVFENEVMLITTKEKADQTLQTVVYDLSQLESVGGRLAPEQVKTILEKTVEPASWESAGGEGSIFNVDDKLLITTSRRLHEKTAEILSLLQRSTTNN